MSKLMRIKRSFLIKIINSCLCGTHFFKLKNNLLKHTGIKCGLNTKVVGPLYLGNVAQVSFGNNVWIGTKFSVYGNGKVVVEDNVDIAPEVSIITGSHEIAFDEQHRAGDGISYHVTIKEGCWIGARVTIMGNTEIGKGSVVAASALVNKSVGSNILCGGVPAKTIRQI